MDIKKKIIQYTSLLLGTILFIVALRYAGISNIIASFHIQNPLNFIYYLLISLLIFSGFVFRWYIILKCHEHFVPFRRLFNYRVAGFAVSYLTPSARLGGEPIRTYFLVKEKMPVEKAISSVFIDKSLELTANIVMTLIGAIIIVFITVLTPQLKWILILVALGSVFLVYVFYSRILKGKGIFTSLILFFKLRHIKFFEKHYQKMRDSELQMTNFFVNFKRVFILSTVISFILWIFTVIEFKLLLSAFGYTPTFVEVFLVLAVIGIAYLIPVPTALGVLEGSQISLFTALGKGPKYGVAVSLVTRIRDFMWTLYGLSYLYAKGVVVNNLLKDSSSKIQLSEKVVYFKKWKIK